VPRFVSYKFIHPETEHYLKRNNSARPLCTPLAVIAEVKRNVILAVIIKPLVTVLVKVKWLKESKDTFITSTLRNTASQLTALKLTSTDKLTKAIRDLRRYI